MESLVQYLLDGFNWRLARELGINILGFVTFVLAVGFIVFPSGVILPMLKSPRCYIFALLINGIWFGVSSALAKTSCGYGLTNLWKDSLVPIQIGVVLLACNLVLDKSRSIVNTPWLWSLSLLLGFLANLLALSDTMYHLQVHDLVDPRSPEAWVMLNVSTLCFYLIGIVWVAACLLGGLLTKGGAGIVVETWFLPFVGRVSLVVVLTEFGVVLYACSR